MGIGDEGEGGIPEIRIDLCKSPGQVRARHPEGTDRKRAWPGQRPRAGNGRENSGEGQKEARSQETL